MVFIWDDTQRFLKGPRHELSSKFSNFIFPYLMSKMDIINKLESCYCLHMCFIGINFNQILISFDDNIIYENIESVFLVCYDIIC